MMEPFQDQDTQETREWLEAIEEVIKVEGPDKALYLIHELIDKSTGLGVSVPCLANTPYANSLNASDSEKIPGNSLVARNVAAYVRWNAMAMVVKANKSFSGIGGHIASFASSAILYEVGFDYFFRGPDSENGGDLVFFQGHSSPGMYSRAFLEGRLSEEQLLNFRREVEGKGLSSYPHPRLMPDFWQFPTVSMGLGPIMAIYQARFMKYMQARDFSQIGKRHVWAFLGDGETDEPESQGAIALAAREKLNNLIFVINCNLQRLDGPVRGNGKIIQELEGNFRGAGWKVIKVIWGTEWDRILERDHKGILLKKFATMVDGEFQALRSKDGAFIREKFFGSDPELLELVKDFSDNDIWQMTRGGHDPRKVYAAYAEALKEDEKPVVILVKTIKGFGMGKAGESANVTHSMKKLDDESLKVFRDRFHVPLKDEDLKKLPFVKPQENSEEARFIQESRKNLGGPLPYRREKADPQKVPPLENFEALLKGSSDKEMSTTMTFVRFISTLTRDKEIGRQIVPIIPDEARTFGMEGLFRQLGIYAPFGQLYEPEDADSMMWYKEDKKGQILEEGINEAGSMSSWIAAGTAYSNYNINMIPFYIFYSMFGFQRIGDLAWAAGDIRARGFLLGATSGRTTLNGEGLQHQDGHSLLQASLIPSCLAYDPTFGYEVVLLIQEGMRRMVEEQEDIFYYITLLNENYPQPEMPKGVEEGIRKGAYLVKEGAKSDKKVQLMGSGSILMEVLAAAEILKKEYQVESDVWSILGVNQLHREAQQCEAENLHRSKGKEQVPYLTELLKNRQGPFIAATDYLSSYVEQIRRLIPGSLKILGTDGWGRSDTREALRGFFRVDRYNIVLTALRSLQQEQKLDPSIADKAQKKYGLTGNHRNGVEL